jgi:hypothetical protein
VTTTERSTKLTSCGRALSEADVVRTTSTVVTAAGRADANRRLVRYTVRTTTSAEAAYRTASPGSPHPRSTYAAAISGSGSVGTHVSVAYADQWAGAASEC